MWGGWVGGSSVSRGIIPWPLLALLLSRCFPHRPVASPSPPFPFSLASSLSSASRCTAHTSAATAAQVLPRRSRAAHRVHLTRFALGQHEKMPSKHSVHACTPAHQTCTHACTLAHTHLLAGVVGEGAQHAQLGADGLARAGGRPQQHVLVGVVQGVEGLSQGVGGVGAGKCMGWWEGAPSEGVLCALGDPEPSTTRTAWVCMGLKCERRYTARYCRLPTGSPGSVWG